MSNKFDCPLADEVTKLQKQYDALIKADIAEEAEKNGILKGLRIAGILIGYTFIVAVLVVVGHIIGFFELISRILKVVI